jgi:hypothetical protein
MIRMLQVALTEHLFSDFLYLYRLIGLPFHIHAYSGSSSYLDELTIGTILEVYAFATSYTSVYRFAWTVVLWMIILV